MEDHSSITISHISSIPLRWLTGEMWIRASKPVVYLKAMMSRL